MTSPTNVVRMRLTHAVPHCFQSPQGARSEGKIPKEICNKTTPVTALSFSLQCSPHSGTFFVCRTRAYAFLSPKWKGICILAFLTPQVNVILNNQPLRIPLAAYTWSKRAIQIIPLLVAMGITAGIGTSIWGISTSIYNYQKFLTEFNNDLKQVSQSIVALQKEADTRLWGTPK
jgi:hypothetical protein